MPAWSNWVGKLCIMAALAVPVALLGVPLALSAEEQQQGQQQPLTQQELQQGMSRFLLKIAQQAFSVAEPMRPWRAVQGWG